MAITSDGKSFYKIGGDWHYEGTIGELSGRVQNGEFTMLVKGLFACAVTNFGELYERNFSVGGWAFSGEIEGGVVSEDSDVMSGVKALFR